MITDYKGQRTKTILAIQENPKLLLSKEWRLNNLYWIQTKSRTGVDNTAKVLFEMNRAQKMVFDCPSRRIIILKARQLGISTFKALDLLDTTLWERNERCGFLAQTQVIAKEIYDNKLRYAIDNLYPEIKALVDIKSTKSGGIIIGFKDKSTSSVTAKHSFRGLTINRLHVSELAKLCNLYPALAKEVIKGTIPAVPLEGQVTIEGTAEGVGNEFYNIFMNAWNAKNRGDYMSAIDYNPIFFDISFDEMEIAKIPDEDIVPAKDMVPCDEIGWAETQKLYGWDDRTLTYYYFKWIQLENDSNLLFQEYPRNPEEAFLATGSTFLPTLRCSKLYAAATDPQHFSIIYDEIFKDEFGKLQVWEEPKRGIKYVIGVDTSDGLAESDYSVATILNTATNAIDAMLRLRCDRTELSGLLFTLGKYYNDAVIAVESNFGATHVVIELQSKGYPNLYYDTDAESATNDVSKRYGFRTTANSRDLMLNVLKKYFLTTHVWRKPFLQEAMIFIRNKKGKYEAQNGKNNFDDIVMATAISYMVMDTWGIKSKDSSGNLINSYMNDMFQDYHLD